MHKHCLDKSGRFTFPRTVFSKVYSVSSITIRPSITRVNCWVDLCDRRLKKKETKHATCWVLPCKQTPFRFSSKNREEEGWNDEWTIRSPLARSKGSLLGGYFAINSWNSNSWRGPIVTRTTLDCQKCCYFIKKKMIMWTLTSWFVLSLLKYKSLSDRHISSRPQGSSTRFQSNTNIAALL